MADPLSEATNDKMFSLSLSMYLSLTPFLMSLLSWSRLLLSF